MKLFGLKNCDTCKKALKALQDADRFEGLITRTDLLNYLRLQVA